MAKNNTIMHTPIGTAVWPKVVVPDTKFNADGVYTCNFECG